MAQTKLNRCLLWLSSSPETQIHQRFHPWAKNLFPLPHVSAKPQWSFHRSSLKTNRKKKKNLVVWQSSLIYSETPPVHPPKHRVHPSSHSHLFQNLGRHFHLPNVFVSIVLWPNKQDCYNCSHNSRCLRKPPGGESLSSERLSPVTGTATPHPIWLMRGTLVAMLPFRDVGTPLGSWVCESG